MDSAVWGLYHISNFKRPETKIRPAFKKNRIYTTLISIKLNLVYITIF
jgi:hypothetical protein